MDVITLNKLDFFKKCLELISKLDFETDLIIGILTGGGYLIEEFKNSNKYKNTEFQTVTIQRKTILKRFFLVGFLLNTLPYFILNWLRVYESKKAEKSINGLNLFKLKDIKLEIKLNSKSNESIKNILIVDDAIDRGRTMFVVKNNLQKLFPDSEINIAVISWTIESSVVKPDYYVFKNILVRFPWSKDYKGKDFEEKSFSN